MTNKCVDLTQFLEKMETVTSQTVENKTESLQKVHVRHAQTTKLLLTEDTAKFQIAIFT